MSNHASIGDFALNEEQIKAIATLGLNYYEQGQTEKARIMFEGLIATTGTYYGYAGMGAIALAQEPPQLDEAYAWLSKAAELNPNDPSVHANLGEVLLRQAKFDAAAAEFHKSLALDPEKRDPGANRARALISALLIVTGELRKMAVAA
jgi:tetratricopeptide (TPR) repeat protein